MPNLQALQAVPSFGGQLGQALGGGLSEGISNGLNQMLQQKQQKKTGSALAEWLGKPEMATAFGQLPEQIQIEIAKGHLRQKQENAANRENAIRSVDDIRQIIDRGNTGINFFNYLTEEGRGDRAALDTAALNLEKLAADMVGKGTLNQQRFQYLKERLPSSSKTDAENRSILNEWEKILNQGDESKNTEKKSSEGKKLSSDEAQKIFKKAGGDANKAREMARKLGYEL